jgi:hypothetical protein
VRHGDLRLVLVQILVEVMQIQKTTLSKTNRFRLGFESLSKFQGQFMAATVSRRFFVKGQFRNSLVVRAYSMDMPASAC